MYNTLKTSYEIKKVVIDIDNVGNLFMIDPDRRKIRDSKVSELAKNIKNGKHFDAIFVVNHVNNEYHLIDGNHRFEAIKRAISMDNSLAIEISYAQYTGLTPEEEDDIFETWNIGTTQSSDDFLQVRFSLIPFGQEMLDKIPSAIYGTPTRIKLRVICGAHITAQKQRFTGGYRAGREQIIQDFSALDMTDIKMMHAFMNEMQGIFGYFTSKNIFFKGTAVTGLYKIWYDNKHLGSDVIRRALGSILLNPQNTIRWQQLCKSSGDEATKYFYRDLTRALQEKENTRGYTGVVFKID
jgi:hypothetical protein